MKKAQELPSWLQDVEQDLISVIALACGEEEELREFLSLLLTPSELYLISCRLRAILLLLEGFKTVEVRELTRYPYHPNISRGVISKANQLIQYRDKGRLLIRLHDRLKQHREFSTD
jgi:Trp operon repressor